jgi:hypothetical protein
VFNLFSVLCTIKHSRPLDFDLGVSLIPSCMLKYIGESLHMTLSEIHPILSVYFYGVGNVTWNIEHFKVLAHSPTLLGFVNYLSNLF